VELAAAMHQTHSPYKAIGATHSTHPGIAVWLYRKTRDGRSPSKCSIVWHRIRDVSKTGATIWHLLSGLVSGNMLKRLASRKAHTKVPHGTLEYAMSISNRVTVSKSALAGGAAIAQIMQAQNTAASSEAGTIAAKQASIIAAAAFVAKHWKNYDVFYMKGNGSKPEQRFNFMVRSLALPAEAFEYGGAGSDMLSRLNTIGSNPAETKAILKDGKATAIGSLAKRVAAQAAAAKRAGKAPIETNQPLETASNPDGSGDAGLPSDNPKGKTETPTVQASHALHTFLAICKKHGLDASVFMIEAMQAMQNAIIEPEVEATKAAKKSA